MGQQRMEPFTPCAASLPAAALDLAEQPQLLHLPADSGLTFSKVHLQGASVVGQTAAMGAWQNRPRASGAAA